MSLKNIKIRVQQYTGLDPTDANDNSLMLQMINEAAREIYNKGDIPGSLDEAVFNLDPTYQIAVPNFAANVRGIREYYSHAKQSLTSMAERYLDNPWYRDWERYRIKANSPIMHDVDNAGVLTISVTGGVLFDSGVITITGSTIASARVTETVTMDAATKTTTNQFRTIHSITSSVPRTYDYTVSDLVGTVLAVLPNNESFTNYQVLLLSSYPWSVVSTTQVMEILYKRAFIPFVNDGDEFISPGYDNSIYFKFQSNWDSSKDGKEERSMLAEAKAMDVMAGEVNDKTAKQPDSRVIVRPSAGMRIQRRMKRGIPLTPYNVFRP